MVTNICYVHDILKADFLEYVSQITRGLSVTGVDSALNVIEFPDAFEGAVFVTTLSENLEVEINPFPSIIGGHQSISKSFHKFAFGNIFEVKNRINLDFVIFNLILNSTPVYELC